MDFYKISEKEERDKKTGEVTRVIRPSFIVCHSRDLMVRGKSFYAVWDEDKGLWSTDEYDVARLVDQELRDYSRTVDGKKRVATLSSFDSGLWLKFQSYLRNVSDNAVSLDGSLTFANTPVRKEMYASKRLPYDLAPGDISAWDTLIGRLYEEKEREKIEWAIGSIVAGESSEIQKFMVLYGSAGSGKSTLLSIVSMLFDGYVATFDSKALGSASAQFALEAFKTNPLVAIQHDGDLSRIEDNTRLNSLVSHEPILVNEKNKPQYEIRPRSFLWMGTNKPVRITDAKSGIIRRLIDAQPSGERFSWEEYSALWNRIPSELGAIAHHCLQVYRERGRSYYDSYIPIEMMWKTDVFYNYIEEYQLELNNGITLDRAYALYKTYCDESLVEWKMPRYKFREELKNYFDEFHDRIRIGGERYRNWYNGFKPDKLGERNQADELVKAGYWLDLNETSGIFDETMGSAKAQYATEDGMPATAWDNVDSTLGDLDPTKLHYVMVPANHIVIDLDIRGADGEKNRDLNLEAAAQFPETYAEFSKSGAGVHLHYVYDGDPAELASEFAHGIEVKVYRGKASLRRRLSYCNALPVNHISKGLPLKEVSVLNDQQVASEKALRDLIERNLRKEIHPGTKPSMDFIKKILDDAYSSDLSYDVSNMRPRILGFAMKSTNQKQTCLKIMGQLHWKSKDLEAQADPAREDTPFGEGELVFFDVEVYPNLFMLSWMPDRDDAEVTTLVNPTSEDLEKVVKMKLVGFNNRRYDNHVTYARYMGSSLEQVYTLSQRIINDDREATFVEAYNMSFTDVWEFSMKKQSLKAWEIELGLPHREMDIPWDQPVKEEDIPKIAAYNQNDVKATRAVFHHLQSDWEARQILAEVAKLTPNASTNQLTQQIIFGADRRPPFVHTDLSEMFPGYKYEYGKSTYRGEEVGEGGYVYSEPGIYKNVALLDVASMHPHSIIALNCFGGYTERFKELVDARLAVKHGDYDVAKTLLGGALKPFLGHDDEALAYSLKIAINIVYGLTSAKFPTRCNGLNPANNLDNIVAKRGALFMIDLKHAVQERGFTVAHIKTDSIKIPDATPEIIDFVYEFGQKYGYSFEHETTYDRMCLVNDAVYLSKDDGGWHATGAQFLERYVFNHLCVGAPDTFEDFVQKKSVRKGAFYIQHGDDTEPDYAFVGRVGSFVPVLPEVPGGALLVKRDEKYVSAAGAKGYRWALVSDILELADADDREPMTYVDPSYSKALLDKAYAAIGEYGDAEAFLS